MRNEREPAVEAKYSEMSILNLKSSVRFADDSVLTLSVCSTVLVERSTRSTRAIELSESPDGVVVTDIMYPYFRESDLALLDEQYGRTDRFLALTSAANLFYERAVSGGASMYVGVSAADVLRGNCDVLQQQLLSANTVVVDVNIDELKNGVSDGKMLYEFDGTPAEITDKCLKFIGDRLKDFNVTVRISGSGATAEELIAAKKKTAEYGYKSFVLG